MALIWIMICRFSGAFNNKIFAKLNSFLLEFVVFMFFRNVLPLRKKRGWSISFLVLVSKQLGTYHYKFNCSTNKAVLYSTWEQEWSCILQQFTHYVVLPMAQGSQMANIKMPRMDFSWNWMRIWEYKRSLKSIYTLNTYIMRSWQRNSADPV